MWEDTFSTHREKKYKYAKMGQTMSNDSYVMPGSGVPVAITSGNSDILIMPGDGVPVNEKQKSSRHQSSNDEEDSSSSGTEESVSLKILQQLRWMNSCLNAVEEQVAAVKTDQQLRQHK